MSGSLFPKPLTVRRVSGSFVNGTWTDGTEITFEIEGSVQPVTGRDTDPREVGRVDTGLVSIRTDAELIASEEGGDAKDFVIWDSREWEVMRRKAYDTGLLPHIEYEAEYRQRTA